MAAVLEPSALYFGECPEGDWYLGAAVPLRFSQSRKKVITVVCYGPVCDGAARHAVVREPEPPLPPQPGPRPLHPDDDWED